MKKNYINPRLTSPEASFLNEQSIPFHLNFDSEDKASLTHTIYFGKTGKGMSFSPVNSSKQPE